MIIIQKKQKLLLSINEYSIEGIAKRNYKIYDYNFSKELSANYKEIKVEMAFGGESYTFPCYILSNTDYLADILRKRQELKKLVAKSKILLDPYKRMIKLPIHNA